MNFWSDKASLSKPNAGNNPQLPPALQLEGWPGHMVLDHRLAVFSQEHDYLIVADLHFGYAASLNHRGALLPDWGEDVVEQRLAALLQDYQPKTLMLLGDLVHSEENWPGFLDFLKRVTKGLRMIFIRGNHDRKTPKTLDWHDHVTLGELCFHHGHLPLGQPSVWEVVGHWHPAFRVGNRTGGTYRAPCFVEQPGRLILPAFSPWAAGTQWASGEGERIWMCSAAGLLPVVLDAKRTNCGGRRSGAQGRR